MGENALHPAVPTCLLLHHQGGGDLVSWAPVFSRTFWWEKYVKVWMELCIKTMSPRLETQWNTYIYIYCISMKRCGKSQQSQQPFLDDSIWFTASSPWDRIRFDSWDRRVPESENMFFAERHSWLLVAFGTVPYDSLSLHSLPRLPLSAHEGHYISQSGILMHTMVAFTSNYQTPCHLPPKLSIRWCLCQFGGW